MIMVLLAAGEDLQFVTLSKLSKLVLVIITQMRNIAKKSTLNFIRCDFAPLRENYFFSTFLLVNKS